MKAFVLNAYGSSDSMKQQDIPMPNPGPGQVQMKVHAVSVNPADWHRMRGAPFLVRLSEGVFRPANPVLGADAAGEITALGPGVEDFRVGDRVFGEISTGGFAEYCCPQSNLLSRIPAELSYIQAASIPVAGLTAYQAMVEKAEVKAGENVLVNGASGGVGSFAVQLAASRRAEVHAVCSSRNSELVRSLGAKRVIEYDRQSLLDDAQSYDVILDAVGNIPLNNLLGKLRSGGRGVVVGFISMPQIMNAMIFGPSRARRQGKALFTFTAQANPEQLAVLASMVADETITPLLDEMYSFEDLPEAMSYVEKGHARGKVVVTLV